MIVTIIAAVSADGKIAQRAGQSSLDWTSKEDTRFFVEKTKEIGTVVMGNTTWQTFGKPLKGRRLIVLSRMAQTTPNPSSPEEGKRVSSPSQGEVKEGSVEFVSEPVADLVARLEREGVTALAVCGGANVYAQFLSAGLVNELFLTVEPVLFGDGVPLAAGIDRVNLEFIDSTMLGDSSVLLHYRVA